jgi:DNA invertase Pin-like site-specific DNA recombinase
MMVGWRAAQLNGGTGKHSRFSEEEILEIRDMYFRMPVKEIAKHFNCHVSLIYRYINRNPNRFRVV